MSAEIQPAMCITRPYTERFNINIPEQKIGTNETANTDPLPFDHHSDVLTCCPNISMYPGNILKITESTQIAAMPVRNLRNPGIWIKFDNIFVFSNAR